MARWKIYYRAHIAALVAGNPVRMLNRAPTDPPPPLTIKIERYEASDTSYNVSVRKPGTKRASWRYSTYEFKMRYADTPQGALDLLRQSLSTRRAVKIREYDDLDRAHRTAQDYRIDPKQENS